MQLRRYQKECVDRVIAENTVINLQTGLGKTLVAVSVLDHYLTSQPTKKVLFAVPTRVLVEQQAEYCRENAAARPCRVAELSGRAMDSWNQRDWDACLHDHEVLVGTPEVFRRALVNGSFMQVSQFSLLIFDECHNATGNSAMAGIMRDGVWPAWHSKKVERCRPRVLGLTASFLNGSAEDVEGKRGQLEALLDCSLFCPPSLPEVQDKSFINVRWFPDARLRSEHVAALLKPLLDKLLDSLKLPVTESHKVLNRAVHVLVELGLKGLVVYYNQVLLPQFQHHVGALQTPRQPLSFVREDQLRHLDVPDFSSKVTVLLQLVSGLMREGAEENPSYKGIVFVERIALTTALKHILNAHFQQAAERWQAGACAGSSAQTDADREGELERFKKGQAQVLVCTAALEEGVDVSECSFVVRFSSFGTTKSHIQGAGRARQSNAQVFYFENDAEAEEAKANRISQVARDDSLRLSQEERARRMENRQVSGVYPWRGLDGSTVINLFNCKQIVFEYCSKVLAQPLKPEALMHYEEEQVRTYPPTSRKYLECFEYPSPEGLVGVTLAQVNRHWGNVSLDDVLDAEQKKKMTSRKRDDCRFLYVVAIDMRERSYLDRHNRPSQDALLRTKLAIPTLPLPDRVNIRNKCGDGSRQAGRPVHHCANGSVSLHENLAHNGPSAASGDWAGSSSIRPRDTGMLTSGDFKSRLNEEAAKRWRHLPIREAVRYNSESNGDVHQPQFRTKVELVPLNESFTGPWVPNKRTSEQAAAEMAVQYLENGLVLAVPGTHEARHECPERYEDIISSETRALTLSGAEPANPSMNPSGSLQPGMLTSGDFKSRLNEEAAKRWRHLPIREAVRYNSESNGDVHQPKFRTKVELVPLNERFTGPWFPNKRTSEQAAAEMAVQYLENGLVLAVPGTHEARHECPERYEDIISSETRALTLSGAEPANPSMNPSGSLQPGMLTSGDFKSRLNEEAAKRWRHLPIREAVRYNSESNGDVHQPQFRTKVELVPLNERFTGPWFPNKRTSEQAAAQMAVQFLVRGPVILEGDRPGADDDSAQKAPESPRGLFASCTKRPECLQPIPSLYKGMLTAASMDGEPGSAESGMQLELHALLRCECGDRGAAATAKPAFSSHTTFDEACAARAALRVHHWLEQFLAFHDLLDNDNCAARAPIRYLIIPLIDRSPQFASASSTCNRAEAVPSAAENMWLDWNVMRNAHMPWARSASVATTADSAANSDESKVSETQIRCRGIAMGWRSEAQVTSGCLMTQLCDPDTLLLCRNVGGEAGDVTMDARLEPGMARRLAQKEISPPATYFDYWQARHPECSELFEREMLLVEATHTPVVRSSCLIPPSSPAAGGSAGAPSPAPSRAEHGEKQQRRGHAIHLPLGVCRRVAVPAEMWRSALELRSVVCKLEALLLAAELGAWLMDGVEAGDANLHLRLVEQLMAATTAPSCFEDSNYERLEVLGDSFLKYAVSQEIFMQHPTADDGQLTLLRAAAVSNERLIQLATTAGLHRFLRTSPLHMVAEPASPPCQREAGGPSRQAISAESGAENDTSRDSDDVTQEQQCSMKVVADSFEAVLGAVLTTFGPSRALRAACRLGAVRHSEEQVESFAAACVALNRQRVPHVSAADMTNEMKRGSGGSGGDPHTCQEVNVEPGEAALGSLETALGYTFAGAQGGAVAVGRGGRLALLQESMCHASCVTCQPSDPRTPGLPSYQRLEFLGDAVLDFLVMERLCSGGLLECCEGMLSEGRALLVNNNHLAEVALELKMSQYLQHNSQALSSGAFQGHFIGG
ncbi:dicer-like protein, variant 2 [Cymbomonas tetramitiformis]|uniref:Dicer-like protein, variant 2 n=1 Tax=Cymbomonas tetramitiformis TaxID=36881 RepID=A0AAE0H4J3_9CHLO|nr:dicer-like protein, variant 2 [Cymbomonas tetramitiformis]